MGRRYGRVQNASEKIQTFVPLNNFNSIEIDAFESSKLYLKIPVQTKEHVWIISVALSQSGIKVFSSKVGIVLFMHARALCSSWRVYLPNTLCFAHVYQDGCVVLHSCNVDYVKYTAQ